MERKGVGLSGQSLATRGDGSESCSGSSAHWAPGGLEPHVVSVIPPNLSSKVNVLISFRDAASSAQGMFGPRSLS